MNDHKLPQEFRELEPFLGWSLETDRERSVKRKTSPMAEIHAFYTAMVPRMDAILSLLEQFPAASDRDGGLSPEIRRLFCLTLSLAKIAPAVEMYGKPVPEGLDALRLETVDIYPGRLLENKAGGERGAVTNVSEADVLPSD